MSLRSNLSQEVQHWYVAYTFPKAEKKVQIKLDTIGVQSYLPLHQVIKSWSDRKKKLIVPLFPNYIFVYTSEKKRNELFTIKEIVKYVSFGGKPAIVNDSIVSVLKNILKENVEVDIVEDIKVGACVKITHGPFTGAEGKVVNRNGKTRLIVQIDALQRAVAINISASDVAPCYAENVISM